jgi:hypothetical protein
LLRFAEGSDGLTTEIGSLVGDVQRTRDALAGTDVLLDGYREAAIAAGELATSSRGDLSSSIKLARAVLVALGVLLVISQYVPLTLASSLDTRRSPDRS